MPGVKSLIGIISFLSASAAFAADLPNSEFTPGHSDPKVLKSTVCKKGYYQPDYTVSIDTRKAVLKRYRIDWNQRSSYEIDLLIPAELGGTNDLKNLWPQPVAQTGQKDQLEQWLLKEVCAGRMELADAQNDISEDWLSLYQFMKKHR
jgi:hypothetical protein